MYKQPELCRKRSAFRQKLRREYIDNLFKKRREELNKQDNHQLEGSECNTNDKKEKRPRNNSNIKEIQEFYIENNIYPETGMKYPFVSGNIPQINSNFSPDSPATYLSLDSESQSKKDALNEKKFIKINQFSSYQQFQQYINEVMRMLPCQVRILVQLFNDNPMLIPQFIKYLFTPQHSLHPSKSLFTNNPTAPSTTNLHRLTHPFTQSTTAQFLSYLHILQAMLVRLPDHSPLRQKLITETSQRVIQRVYHLIDKAKIMRYEILKGFFQYLVTLGDDIYLLGRLEFMMVCDNVREVFGKWYVGDSDGNGVDWGLYDSLVLVCNNIISMNPNQSRTPNLSHLDVAYQIHQQKSVFLTQLLQCPQTIKNLISQSLCPSTSTQLENTLRFLINLTYMIDQPAKLHLFLTPLTVMVLRILAEWRFYWTFSAINLLMLRLVNNVVVGDPGGALAMGEVGIGKCVEVYGGWVLAGCGGHLGDVKIDSTNYSQCKQPQQHVYNQFLSTISSYIITLHSYLSCSKIDQQCPTLNEPQSQTSSDSPQSKSQYHHRYQIDPITNLLSSLIRDKHIQVILLQSLRIGCLRYMDVDVLERVLETVLVLADFEGKVVEGDGVGAVRRVLVGYQEVLQGILDNPNTYTDIESQNSGQTANNIEVFCQQLLEIISNTERQLQQQQNDKAMYEQYYAKYCGNTNHELIQSKNNNKSDHKGNNNGQQA